MGRFRGWAARAWGSLGVRRSDADLEAELRSHLDLAAPGAQVGLAHAMDALRDQRGLPWLDDSARDIRHGLRLLRAQPLFTAVAVLSLALGIGANSAIFSLADELLLRPLPVPDPSSIVTVSADRPEEEFEGGALSYPNYRDIRDRARSFDGLLAYSLTMAAFSRTSTDAREMRTGMFVSDNYFDTLRVTPAIGRLFTRDEARVPGRDAVVVVADDFWRATLAGDPSIVNRAIWLNGMAFQVVGVAPPSFTGTEPPVRPAFYVPAAMATRLRAQGPDTLEQRDARRFVVKGRLRAGVSIGQARAELQTIWRDLARQFPESDGQLVPAVRTELATRLRSDPWDALAMALLLALAALVLVIACANVASLLLGRDRARTREIAIRLALGVSRSRLLRQLLTESLLLAVLGCLAGLAVSYAGIRFLQTFPTGDQIVILPQLDARVVVFSAIVAAVSAGLFGIGPARQSLKADLVPALKASQPGGAGGRRRGRSVIVVAQIALSMVLLVATGMLLDGFRQALALNPGFRTDHLVMLSLDPSLVGYSPAQTTTFYRTLVDRARALPTVRSAALTNAVPLQVGINSQDMSSIVPEGYVLPPGQQSVSVFDAVVGDRYFDTMGIPIVRGRAFADTDAADARRVAIVNEEFARRFWPNQDPIGKRVRLADPPGPWMVVVGVTPTAKYTWIAELPMPFVYLPFAQQPRTNMTLVVESAAADASPLAGPLRNLVRSLDVAQPISREQTYAQLYRERAVRMPTILAQTVTAIGALGLALTLVGLYGLVAYSVARRTREIGIRMAIGAAKRDVLRMVLRQGVRLSLCGIGIGGLASIVVARTLAAAMLGVGAPTPVLYAAVPVALLGFTVVASYFPARRASLVDPLIALRDE